MWSPVVGYKAVALRDRGYRITATTADLLKDVQLAVDLQMSTGVRATVSSAILDALRQAAASGYRDEDCISVASALQAASGLEPDLQSTRFEAPSSPATPDSP